jgi:hypothetical protein
MQRKLLGIISVDFDKTGQILEKKWEYNDAVHQLFINFKNVYDSVRRDILCNILIASVIP